MIISDVFTGPAGSGKSTKLKRMAAIGRENGLQVLEVCATAIYKADLEALLAKVQPDMLCLDEWDLAACDWHPETLNGPEKTRVYYAVSN